MKYPKINTLWKREEEANKGKIIIGSYSCEEFGIINKWQVQEKIDGTNIRICFNKDENGHTSVAFHGRSDDATIPIHLQKYLNSHFTTERLLKVFENKMTDSVILFGEGYGPKIQKVGGNYRQEVGFILFDVLCGKWWLKQENVKEIAEELQVPYPAIIGEMTESEIVEYVQSNPLSLCSKTPQVMEGIIARSNPLLLMRNGERLMFKLKFRDFK